MFKLMLTSRDDRIHRLDCGYGPRSVMLLFERETRVERPKLMVFHGLMTTKPLFLAADHHTSSECFVCLGPFPSPTTSLTACTAQ